MKLVMKHQAQFLLVTFLTPFISAFISTPSKQKCFQWRLSSESGDELNDGGKSLSSVLLKRDQDEREVNSVISSLETTFLGPNSRSKSRFKDLIDLYEVQWVLSSNKKNNPVGGKWTNENGLAQKLFRTRKTFQHLLPYNETGLARHSETAVAEAINVISLDALNGMIRITVILRGDAVPLSSEEIAQTNSNRTIPPLSNLAVRAFFDPPRICFGKHKCNGYTYLSLQLGPVSNVVLDTTYYDDALRIGMGGTSGTRFVFARTTDKEATEFKSLLSQPLVKRGKLIRRLGFLSAMSFFVASKEACMSNIWGRMVGMTSSPKAQLVLGELFISKGLRILARISAVVTGLALLLLSFSSGGIERDEMVGK